MPFLSWLFASLTTAAGIGVLLTGHPGWSFAFAPAVGYFVYQALCPPKKKGPPKYVLELGRVRWSEDDFCRGWEIDGRTGSGKTASAVIPIIHALKKNRPDIGILALDTKGDLSEPIAAVARDLNCEGDLVQLEVRPDDAPPGWKPPHTVNFLADTSVPYSTYAKILVDVATAAGQKGGQAFFKNAAQVAIQNTFSAMAALRASVTIDNCFAMITHSDFLREQAKELAEVAKTQPHLTYLVDYYADLINQPPEQLGGIRSTVFNYLQPFVTPDIAEVFCPIDPTFDLKQIDQGKLITVKIPQKYQVEKKYVSLLLKVMFYLHALRRYDIPAAERNKKNLIVMVLDEAQETVLISEDGISDYNVIDKIRGARATTIFGAGTVVRLMSDLDHFTYYKRFLNPSLADQIDTNFKTLFQPELSIQELCWDSDGVGFQNKAGFYLDGNYHAIFSIKRWPQRTYPGIVYRLTSLPFLDYQITINLDPIPVREEISREEKAIDRLRGDYESEGKHSLSVALRKKERKVDSLAQGFAYPFHVAYFVRVWDRTETGLHAKCAAIKNAIQQMNGAQVTESLGGTPIVIHPDGQLTINYLDTQGLPLNQLQIATAVALVSKMIGESPSAEKQQLRQAQVGQYVQQLYTDTFHEWANRHTDKIPRLQRLACAVHKWRQEKMGLESTHLEAFAELRDRMESTNDEALTFYASISEDEITRFLKEPQTERFLMQTAYSAFQPDEYPTHSGLLDLMFFSRFPEHPKDEIDHIATLLTAWTASGQYGKLFDGTTNISLTGKITHFELGYIPEQAVELKTAAGLLISGFTRQHIISLPRQLWKRIIFEEAARFLDVPGGEKIMGEGYAQLRKFNCWIISIVQQYSKFKGTRIRPVIMGNSKQFFLMRQFDRSDLEDISQDIQLPEVMIDAVQHYPLPEQQAAGQKFSSLCYYSPTVHPPLCGTLRHVAAPPATSSPTL